MVKTKHPLIVSTFIVFLLLFSYIVYLEAECMPHESCTNNRSYILPLFGESLLPVPLPETIFDHDSMQSDGILPPHTDKSNSRPNDTHHTDLPNETYHTSRPNDTQRTSQPKNTQRKNQPKDSHRTRKPKGTSLTSQPNDNRRTIQPNETSLTSQPNDTHRTSQPNNTRRTNKPKDTEHDIFKSNDTLHKPISRKRINMQRNKTKEESHENIYEANKTQDVVIRDQEQEEVDVDDVGHNTDTLNTIQRNNIQHMTMLSTAIQPLELLSTTTEHNDRKHLANDRHNSSSIPDMTPWYQDWKFYVLSICLTLATAGCLLCLRSACGRCGSVCVCSCCVPVRARIRRRPASDRDSAGSCYLPPLYSRCNSLYRMPPPYSEVTSKPDLYPLVVATQNDKGAGNVLTVHYFHNYVVRPTGQGSLSAASTDESLNSNNTCIGAIEANSIIPPPYSFSSNSEDSHGTISNHGRDDAMSRSQSMLAGDTPPPRPPRRSRTAPSAHMSTQYSSDASPSRMHRRLPPNLPNEIDIKKYHRGQEVGIYNATSPITPDSDLYGIEHNRRMIVRDICNVPSTSYSSSYYPPEVHYRRPKEKVKTAMYKTSFCLSFSDNKSRKHATSKRSSRSAPTTPNNASNVLSLPQYVEGAPRMLQEDIDPLLEHYSHNEHKF